jgi:hypothetical protein
VENKSIFSNNRSRNILILANSGPETAFWIFLDPESDSFLETEITRMVHILGPEIARIWLFLEPEIAKMVQLMGP